MSEEDKLAKVVEKKAPSTKSEDKMVAVIKVRGNIGVNKDIKDTMDMLGLYNRNFCSVHKVTPSLKGMIKKCKDYVTWGEISEDTLNKLIKLRGEEDPKNKGKTKKFFRLNSPKKGYGRKGIKVPFKLGGALGDRGEKINDLIIRML